MMRLNELMMKAMKAFNFISGSSAEEEDLKKHRESVEKMSRLVTPKDDVNIAHFKVGDIDCEAIRSCENFNPHYAIMYAHGGGYMSGGADYARILGTKLAIATGFTTVTFSYRLSPEHPYPAAIEDGMDVWNYLTRGVVSPTHLYLAGDSAGGNLALCLTQMLLSEGREVPKGLILFSPWTDMTGNAESYETNKDVDPVLSKEFVENAVKHGIAPKMDVGTLTIAAWETTDSYMIRIADDGVGFDTTLPYDQRGGHGLGLNNAIQRLQIMVNGSVAIKSSPGDGTEATITIPKLKEEDFDEDDLG